MKPNSGRGGNERNYSWTQTLSEVTVTIPLSSPKVHGGAKCKRNVKCLMTDNHIMVRVDNCKPILLGKLYAAISSDGSFWAFDRHDGVVTLHLEKQDIIHWWACVIVGHREIDLDYLDPGSHWPLLFASAFCAFFSSRNACMHAPHALHSLFPLLPFLFFFILHSFDTTLIIELFHVFFIFLQIFTFFFIIITSFQSEPSAVTYPEKATPLSCHHL